MATITIEESIADPQAPNFRGTYKTQRYPDQTATGYRITIERRSVAEGSRLVLDLPHVSDADEIVRMLSTTIASLKTTLEHLRAAGFKL